jgi:hypothetical protein
MAKVKERRKGKQALSRTVLRERIGQQRGEPKLIERSAELRQITPRRRNPRTTPGVRARAGYSSPRIRRPSAVIMD